jgi:hypothetical protein
LILKNVKIFTKKTHKHPHFLVIKKGKNSDQKKATGHTMGGQSKTQEMAMEAVGSKTIDK